MFQRDWRMSGIDRDGALIPIECRPPGQNNAQAFYFYAVSRRKLEV
ncbi:MAG: hypothetical protein K6T99_01550 [Armatimonadetes bacterium]|nr:hypothetical protein [Armatimonadota bacterium]